MRLSTKVEHLVSQLIAKGVARAACTDPADHIYPHGYSRCPTAHHDRATGCIQQLPNQPRPAAGRHVMRSTAATIKRTSHDGEATLAPALLEEGSPGDLEGTTYGEYMPSNVCLWFASFAFLDARHGRDILPFSFWFSNSVLTSGISYGATSSNKHWNSGRTQTSYKPLQGRPYVHQLPQQRGKQRRLQRRRGRSGLSMLQLLFSTAICMDFRSISSYLSKRTLRYSYIPEASALFRCIYVKRPPQHAAGSPGPKSGRVDYNIIGNATTSPSDFT